MKTQMKNTLNLLARKLFFFSLSTALTVFVACSNENNTEPDFSSDDKENASFEVEEDYYFDDADDIATEAFASEDQSSTGGRVASDDRLTGAIVARVGLFSQGSFRVNFGEGCKDLRGNLRKGLIIIDHVGRWNEVGAHWTITFVGYSMNGVKIEGTRNVTVTGATETLITHEVELIGGKITWPDGSIATREGHHIREHERNENHLLDRLIIYGTAQGTLRNGRSFSIEILERLIYDRSCAALGVIIPVQGKKVIKHGERELTVDYGDGTCDNFVTLTNKSGQTVRYEVGG